MSKEIKPNQKLVIDTLFTNQFNRAEAYLAGYPNAARSSAAVLMHQLLKIESVKEYYDQQYKEFQAMITLDKHAMLDNLINQINQYEEMLTLASKKDITEDEAYKLKRLSSVIKGSDVMKAKDMICRIIGAYEPDKIEISEKTYNIGFDLGENDVEIIE